MVNKNSKNINKREDKISRFCTFLSKMDINEEAKITNIHEEIGTHVNTVKDMIDMYETLRNAPKIQIVRDGKGNVKRIARIEDGEDELFFKKEVRNSIADINNKIDSMMQLIKSMPQEVKKKQSGKKSG